MDFKTKLLSIKEIKNPGWEIQKKMAPDSRKNLAGTFEKEALNFKHAAVLICFCNISYSDGKIIMIKRKKHPSDPHASQMAFPGGRVELSDKSNLQTALREFQEETGILKIPLIIKELSPLPIPISRFIVHPFVGLLDQDFNLKPNTKEVENIFQIPFSFFKNDSNKGVFKIKNAFDAPGWKYENQIIWGASAMMLEELIYILS